MRSEVPGADRQRAATPGRVIHIVISMPGSAAGAAAACNTGVATIRIFKRTPNESALRNVMDGRASGEGARRFNP